jgi:flagellar basal body-associated protein FliL
MALPPHGEARPTSQPGHPDPIPSPDPGPPVPIPPPDPVPVPEPPHADFPPVGSYPGEPGHPDETPSAPAPAPALPPAAAAMGTAPPSGDADLTRTEVQAEADAEAVQPVTPAQPPVPAEQPTTPAWEQPTTPAWEQPNAPSFGGDTTQAGSSAQTGWIPPVPSGPGAPTDGGQFAGAAPPDSPQPSPGYQNQGYQPLGYDTQGHQTQGYQAQAYPNQGYPNQGQGYAGPGYGAPGQPAEGYPAGAYPGAPVSGGHMPWQVSGAEPPKRRRTGLWVSLALVITVLLCGGGGVSAFLLLRNAEAGDGAPDPATAVQEFMTAVYRDKNATAASELVCSESRDAKKISSKVAEVKAYDNQYDQPRFAWDDPSVAGETEERATVSVALTMTTQDEKTAQQQLTFTVVKKTGWWVCEIAG